MNRTHRLYIEGQITSQGFGQFYKPAEQRLNQLLAERPRLEAEVAHLTVTDLSVEEVTSEAKRLYTQWPTLPLDNKRSIVESIVEKVTIGKDEIDLTLSYLPSSDELVKCQQEIRTTRCPGQRGAQEASPSFPSHLGMQYLAITVVDNRYTYSQCGYMTATVQKWGNSLALRIPSAVARQIQVESGDAVELKIEKGALMIRAARPRYRLADLVARINPGNRHEEVDWGKSVGQEI